MGDYILILLFEVGKLPLWVVTFPRQGILNMYNWIEQAEHQHGCIRCSVSDYRYDMTNSLRVLQLCLPCYDTL